MDESMEKFSLKSLLSTTPSSASASKISDNERKCAASPHISSRPNKMTITDGTFFREVPEKCIFETTVAICVKCEPNRIEIKGTGASSSNFLCHLKRKHGTEAILEYRRYICSKSRVKTQRGQLKNKESTPFQKNLEDNILKYVLHSMVPLKAVSDPFFWRIFESMNVPRRDLSIISSHSWESKIEHLYTMTTEQIRSKLNEMSYVSCMVNVWSIGNTSFLVTTAHGIDKNFRRKSMLLRFQSLINKRSLDNIAKMMEKTQEEFELWTAKTITVVEEHNFSFHQAFQSFGIESSSLDGLDELEISTNEGDADSDLDLNAAGIYLDKDVLKPLSLDPFKCPVQTLHLCASTDLVKTILGCRCLSHMHESVIKKCNFLWNHTEPVSAVVGFSLTRPCASNWSSIYTSLREILTLRDKSVEVFQAIDNKDYLLESEFLYIEEHLTCTKPMADALEILQGNDHTLYGSLLPTLLVLRRKLNQLLEREWVYCRPLAVENVRMINEKFVDFFNFNTPESLDASVASFSHPGFKNSWLSCVETKYQTRVTQAFKEAIAAELPPVQPTAVGKLQANEHDFFDFGTENEVVEPVSLITVAEMQALNYFNHAGRNLAVVDNFPEIRKVFLEYNTPLSSFATAERAFGCKAFKEVLQLGQPIDKYTEMRIFLKANMETINSI